MVSKDVKDIFGVVKKVAMNKKFQIGLTLVLFLVILITSMHMRLSNINLLKDQTDGQYLSADLDALYWMREAAVLNDNNWAYPAVDTLRAPAFHLGFVKELMPYVVLASYKLATAFNGSLTLRFIDNVVPAYLYGLGLIIFFFLVYILTKSKTVSVLASAFLAYSPAYLFRSTTGVADHDVLGMIPLFAIFAIFVFGMKKHEESIKKALIYAAIIGLLTALALVAWGGVVTFILMVLPFAFIFYYLLNSQKRLNSVIFYLAWIIFSILFCPLFGYTFSNMIDKFVSSFGLVSLLVGGFILVDFLLEKYKHLVPKIKDLNENSSKILSLIITIILGLVGLTIIGHNPLTMFASMWEQLIRPFSAGIGRVGSTVAEQGQPYLTDLMSQTGKVLFWLFFAGMVLIGAEFAKEIKNLGYKILFNVGWLAIVFGSLFTRISSSSVLNGESFLSQALYFLGLAGFFVIFFYVYSKEKFKVKTEVIVLSALAFLTLLNARTALRIFFLITPFICMIAAYFVIRVYDYIKSSKEQTVKYILRTVFILSIILCFIILFGNPLSPQTQPGFYQITEYQAAHIGPSVNIEWQNAMSWVRNNTTTDSIFVHWWDYGYFIQTLSGRPTVTDGGHATTDVGDHYIGRYLLTTDNPKTALSYMKTWNVSYLLIDPSDLGKYPAYSRIGSNDSWDRYSIIPVGAMDEKQTQETAEGQMLVYPLGGVVDEDINYNGTFLPGPTYDRYGTPSYKSYIAGVILQMNNNQSNNTGVKQPIGVFIYNGKQYRMPLRYLYFNGELYDFKVGLDSVFRVLNFIDTNKNSINSLGAGIYLSPRTSETLFARLYLMNDPLKQYPTIKKAYFSNENIMEYLKTQGIQDDFAYINGGFVGPLAIWKVSYSPDVVVEPEFLNLNIGLGSGSTPFGWLDKKFD